MTQRHYDLSKLQKMLQGMKDLTSEEVQEDFKRIRFTYKRNKTEIHNLIEKLHNNQDFFKDTGIQPIGMYGLDITKLSTAITQYINQDIAKKINSQTA